MSQILPHSSPRLLAGSLNPIAGDWPALKIFFHKDDAVHGSTTWSSRIGGYTITFSHPIVVDAEGVGLSNVNATQTLTGTLPTIGVGFPLLAVSGVFNAAANTWYVGDNSDASADISVQGAGLAYITKDASNYLNSGVLSVAPTYPMTGAMVILGDTSAANEARKYAANNALTYNSSSVKVGGNSAGTIAGAWGAFTVNKILLPASTAPRTRSLAFFIFSALPTDADRAAVFMAKYPGRLPPFWLHKL